MFIAKASGSIDLSRSLLVYIAICITFETFYLTFKVHKSVNFVHDLATLDFAIEDSSLLWSTRVRVTHEARQFRIQIGFIQSQPLDISVIFPVLLEFNGQNSATDSVTN